MPRAEAGASTLVPAGIDDASDVWIVRNDALEALLLNRNVTGQPFGELCEAASQAFVAHVVDELEESGADGIAELLLLSKSYAYNLRKAAQEHDVAVAVNMIATQRAAVQGESAQIEVPYASLDADARTILIGDTIASGATVCAALGRYLEHRRIDRALLFSVAGSVVGARRISHFCAARGVQATILLGLAAFGLADNGFDLSFAHPATICAPDLREQAARAFADRPVSAPGWDFGSQLMAPDKYRALCWVEERYWGLENSGVFALARQPTDRRQIQKEFPAFRDRFPDLDALVADSR